MADDGQGDSGGGSARNADWAPGMLVRHPDQPDWGLGQVQSAIGTRVTVNFEHAGKLLIDVSVVELVPAEPE
ncbi:DUF3553 domain-containing protein [Tistlia consotensis]|uniref:DUF3553 domain-containing protein n=1 Tax=Tistlia consotensis TaxID=1321365 RepID=UPI000A155BD8